MAKHETDQRYRGWPAPDRLAWERAVTDTASDFLDDRPRLAEWAPSTQRNARNAVGAFLRWVEARVPLSADGSLADNTTPALLAAYIRDVLSSQVARTAAYTVWLLDGALRVFAPDRDWDWIKTIARGLKTRARAQPPSDRRIVHAAVLYDLGLQVMRESRTADGSVAPPLYRSGLAVALLAAAPMRIANFAALEVGRHLRQEGSRWVIHLAAEETKTQRADIWSIAGRLSACLDQYLEEVRPVLQQRARQHVETARLWIGDSGRPIGDQVLRRSIATLTHERLGIQVNPHTFRHCAATTFALELPRDALQSSALLGHASPQTTQRHYIIQQRQLVQQEYLRLLQARSHSAPKCEL